MLKEIKSYKGESQFSTMFANNKNKNTYPCVKELTKESPSLKLIFESQI